MPFFSLPQEAACENGDLQPRDGDSLLKLMSFFRFRRHDGMGVWNFLSASLRKWTFFEDGNPAFDLRLVGRSNKLTDGYYHTVTVWMLLYNSYCPPVTNQQIVFILFIFFVQNCLIIEAQFLK